MKNIFQQPKTPQEKFQKANEQINRDYEKEVRIAKNIIKQISETQEPNDAQLNSLIENIYTVCDWEKELELEQKINKYTASLKEFDYPNKQIVDGIISIAKDGGYINIERL